MTSACPEAALVYFLLSMHQYCLFGSNYKLGVFIKAFLLIMPLCDGSVLRLPLSVTEPQCGQVMAEM